MATILGPWAVGIEHDIKPGETRDLFWDGTQDYDWNVTWTVCAIPLRTPVDVDRPGSEVVVEQRIIVEQMWFLRKGQGATNPNQLQLNFRIKNIGDYNSHAQVVISGIGP